MTPEQKQALQEHIQAIAKILYEDTSPERLTNLAGIEEAFFCHFFTSSQLIVVISPPLCAIAVRRAAGIAGVNAT